MKQISFLAFDLGATSGRSILGTLNEGKLQMKELTRFPNQILELNGHAYWNIFSLYEHLKAGMIAAAKEDVEITSIGIDTWGVDFVFLGDDGQILGIPHAYRDQHTVGAPEEYFKNVMPRKEVYDLTGIQILNFNSLYQLYAMKRDKSSLLNAAKEALFIPDALSYMLTGKKVVEYTIASTSQILNPRTKKFETQLLEKMGVKPDLFGNIVMPGYIIGTLTDALAAETGLGKLPVVAVAGHDTASAVAAVPAKNEKFAYLSSGTWSLMGIEVKDPIITEETSTLNITNEGGVEGTTRLLKNITGMWILEQCIKEWRKEAIEYTYPEIVKMARDAAPFQSFIDPDDESFANPPSMIKAIKEFCQKTGQRRDTFREQVQGFGRSEAQKAVQAEKADLTHRDYNDIIYMKGKMSDRDVRLWYVAHDKNIPNLIDKTKPIEDQARQACDLRNQYRYQARELMVDQEKRKKLDITDPIKSFDELMQHKMKDKGLSYEEALTDIVKTATKTRKSVNDELGVEG